ncbi:MAG: multidrug efflux SMR transporter [Gluconacetobacter sp.]
MQDVTAYLHLAMAIIAEVFATSCLKYTDQFTRPVPTLLTFGGYGIAFFFLSLTLRVLPTGIAYAIWSGAGIVLISAINWIWLKQRLDAPAVAGMALIVLGVAVINLFSRSMLTCSGVRITAPLNGLV